LPVSRARASRDDGRYTDPPRDARGNIIFPIELGMLSVHALGRVRDGTMCIVCVIVCACAQIVHDRSEFHTDRYIYPVGFKTSRMFFSMLDPVRDAQFVLCADACARRIIAFDMTARFSTVARCSTYATC
jgi:hypothetical protein